MALKLITAPTEFPITLAQAKAHLRVDHDDDDDLIESLIEAVTDYAEKFQGRSLIEQTWDLYLDELPTDGVIEIPRPPLLEVLGMFYLDSDGGEQTYSADSYDVDLASEPGRVRLAYGATWPTVYGGANAVRIRFRAGYLDASSPPVANVPGATISALKLALGTLYEHRETLVVGQSIAQLPWAAEQLLRLRRVEKAMA